MVFLVSEQLLVVQAENLKISPVDYLLTFNSMPNHS